MATGFEIDEDTAVDFESQKWRLDAPTVCGCRESTSSTSCSQRTVPHIVTRHTSGLLSSVMGLKSLLCSCFGEASPPDLHYKAVDQLALPKVVCGGSLTLESIDPFIPESPGLHLPDALTPNISLIYAFHPPSPPLPN